MNKLKRFAIYGFLGFLIEVLWTGAGALIIQGNPVMEGHTSLWMFFVYGSAVFFLEPVHEKIRQKNVFVRGVVWVLLIWAIELFSGLLFKSVGLSPWDYSSAGARSFLGLIRWDYAPAWFAVGLLFEKAHDYLEREEEGKKA